jgi:predicted  nucleic acid-binding Zn-ribbon protein
MPGFAPAVIEVIVEEQLKRLMELQRLSLLTVQMASEMENIPGRIELVGEKLRISDQRAAELEGQKEEAGKESRRLGGQMEEFQQKISGYKSKLNNSKEITTNEQYRAMERQIEAADESSYEILESQYEVEELAKRIASELQRHKVDHELVCKQCEEERVTLEAKREKILAEKDGLAQRIEALERSVDPVVLSVFKRVASARGGVGVARVVGETCMSCHVRLRPQLVCEVKLLSEIQNCDNCKRILFWAGNQPPAAAPEAEAAT